MTMLALNIKKVARAIEIVEMEERAEVLNELIERAFNTFGPEMSVRLEFNARLFTELRERKSWPPR